MIKPDFVHTTSIKTTAQKLWQAGSPLRFTKPGVQACGWRSCTEESRRQGLLRVTFKIKPQDKVVRLTVTHQGHADGGRTPRDISAGWPMAIARLKSLLGSGYGFEIGPPSRTEMELAHV